MSDQTLFEKLQLKDEKNLLIQGIPSTIEKQFIKLSFAKCVTPLLKIKKIEFALVFAVSKKQLCDIITEVFPILQPGAKVWIAYPKITSKIASDLNRDCHWEVLDKYGFVADEQIAIDNTWTAVMFKKQQSAPVKKTNFNSATVLASTDYNGRSLDIDVPEELKVLFKKNKPAETFFESLPMNNRKEYVEWVIGAKRSDTKSKRLDAVVEKLSTGKRTPTAR
ncbi:MAG: YdeI/OmpD-associated family protein [Bacteroidetes bacterium]|nr:YdeI/OmpD-associated family protein [Bacteroidota bacterium]